jgi:ketosteroid isomerase-like protein
MTSTAPLSDRQIVVERYVEGFRAGDHAAIHACLTDDVTWDIVGYTTATGREAFDALIDGPPGASLPRLTITHHLEDGDVVATYGSGEFDDAEGALQRFRFADTFTFRGQLICAVTSYVVALSLPLVRISGDGEGH